MLNFYTVVVEEGNKEIKISPIYHRNGRFHVKNAKHFIKRKKLSINNHNFNSIVNRVLGPCGRNELPIQSKRTHYL